MSPDVMTATPAAGRYDVDVARDVRIPTADPSVSLSADVYRPRGVRRAPALITLLPYRKDLGAGVGGDAILRWFAARGYVAMLVDLRGTGASDGALRLPFDAADADDGCAAVEWAATQPWCNGRIGVWGHSYGAVMALRTASRQPEHLTAILPVMGMLDPERDFVHPNGLRGCLASLGIWGTQNLLNQVLPPLEAEGSPEQQTRWRQRLAATPWLVDLFRNRPGDAGWRPRVVDASRIMVPTFTVAGWRDLFCDGSIRAHEQIAAPKKLLAGPWMHTMPEASLFATIDFPALALRWWDHWLRDIDNSVMDEPPVVVYLQGSSPGWRQLPDWPAHAHATFTGIRSGDDLHLAERSGEAAPLEPTVSLAAAVDPTVGPLSGLGHIPTSGVGLPLDQHDDDHRSVAFTSPRLEDDIEILGRPTLRIDHHGSVVPQLISRLADVDHEARSTLITSGAASSAADGSIVVFDPTGYRVAAGHRLRVTLSAADFPRLWPLDQSSQQAIAAAKLSRLTLELPVLSGDDVGSPAALPGPVRDGRDGQTLILNAHPTWTIARDIIGNGVSVVVGDRLEALTADQSHHLQLEHHAEASVDPRQPDAAAVQATCRADVRGPLRVDLTAQVEVRLTTNTLSAKAWVVRGDEELFSGTWAV